MKILPDTKSKFSTLNQRLAFVVCSQFETSLVSSGTPPARATYTVPNNIRGTPQQGPLAEYMRFGSCNQICRHCRPFFWIQDRLAASRSRVEYHRCCLGGRVVLHLNYGTQ